jgi:hypothetical protein
MHTIYRQPAHHHHGQQRANKKRPILKPDKPQIIFRKYLSPKKIEVTQAYIRYF